MICFFGFDFVLECEVGEGIYGSCSGLKSSRAAPVLFSLSIATLNVGGSNTPDRQAYSLQRSAVRGVPQAVGSCRGQCKRPLAE